MGRNTEPTATADETLVSAFPLPPDRKRAEALHRLQIGLAGIGAMVLLIGLASAILATTLRFFVQLRGQSLTSASHAAVILMLEPMWTALVAAWWFGETMSAQQFLGCALIFSALVLSRWRWVRDLLRSLG